MSGSTRPSVGLTGRYEIEREIGAGGMATVYLARDLRHNRKVALKVLHPELSAIIGTERFLKEIELTANLQHPHILPLFDSGETDGQLFYVMPFVEGESLRARLDRERQLPVAEAIRITTEVADALEYAHKRGLVHRDIKPENILLHEGRALVADFGIALAVQQAGSEGRMTQTGLSLGTPHYMAPEQAMGERGVDARADVYALGAMIYEMLAGEPPFTGPSSPAILSKVLTERPRNVRVARPQVPETVAAAIDVALEKLPADRLQSMAEFIEALSGKIGLPTRAVPSSRTGRAKAWRIPIRQMVPGILTGFVLAIAGWLALRATGLLENAEAGGTPGAVSLELSLPGPVSGLRPFAVSPDGSTYAIVVLDPDGRTRIHVRRADETVDRPIAGTENALAPGFTPDGEWVFFSAGGSLQRVSLNGGTPVHVADIERSQSSAWLGERIVIGGNLGGGGLRVVPASGGTPEPFTEVEAGSHRGPVAAPDGETVFFFANGQTTGVVTMGVASLRKGGWQALDLAGFPIGYLEGLLVYHDGVSSLLGVPFNLKTQRVTGSPVLLVEDVAFTASGLAPRAAMSSSGTLIYESGTTEGEIVSLSMEGIATAQGPQVGRFEQVRYSPDGTLVAATVGGAGDPEVWLANLGAGTLERFSPPGLSAYRPEWSADGRSLVTYDGGSLHLQSLDGAEPRQRLQAGAWGAPTPDGSAMLFRNTGAGAAGNDLFWRSLSGDTTRKPIAASPNYQTDNATLSPDGRWVAFATDETGAWEVYVQPFPGPGRRLAVSSGGGRNAVWHPDGERIFYNSPTHMYEARVVLEPSFRVTRRELFAFEASQLPFFQQEFYRGWDLAPDGNHFLAVRPVGGEIPKVHVIHNWGALVRERLAAR